MGARLVQVDRDRKYPVIVFPPEATADPAGSGTRLAKARALNVCGFPALIPNKGGTMHRVDPGYPGVKAPEQDLKSLLSTV
jgi:hypothetical protein